MRGEAEGHKPQCDFMTLCLLYLSDVLIGGEDNFVKSRGRDLDSLLEGEGHHGSLKNEKE